MDSRPLFVTILSFALTSPALRAAAPEDFSASSSTFSVEKSTQVPGELLKPGSYRIQILDQLTDRMIIRVDSLTSKEHAIFLGVPRPNLSRGIGSGAVNWDTGSHGTPTLRGYSFAVGSSVEFVYPKAEAVALAKLNATKVIAIDPQSEGRPVLKGLSTDDLQVVNLWLLSLTTTGPNGNTPAVLAQRMDHGTASQMAVNWSGSVKPAPVQPTPVKQTTQVARVEQPSMPQALTSAPPRMRRHPAMAALPHTASFVPLVWLAGILFFLAAFVLRVMQPALLRREG